MAPRPRRVAPEPKRTERKTSSTRIEDLRGETPYDERVRRKNDYPAFERFLNSRPTAATARTIDEFANRPRKPKYGTSMAENMNSYFNRLMAQPGQGKQVKFEDGSVGMQQGRPTRYGEVAYGDIDQTQKHFRENLRQAMLRKQAYGILEGGAPSTSQMMTRSDRRAKLGPFTDISDVPVDPVFGQNIPSQGYLSGYVPTLEAALAERRRMMPMLPAQAQANMWNQRPR